MTVMYKCPKGDEVPKESLGGSRMLQEYPKGNPAACIFFSMGSFPMAVKRNQGPPSHF
ncbi:unnamed protein product [Prunus brigantina]